MIFRLRLPAALARVALKRAGTSRRLSEVLVEALRDTDIFARLMARTEPDGPPDEECLEDAALRQQDILQGPWRDS